MPTHDRCSPPGAATGPLRPLATTALAFAAGLGVAFGCAGAEPVPAGPTVEVRVAPLALSGPVDATYTLTVRNSATATVWTRSGLRSSAYGDGAGSLSYVGSCDADASPNTVEVVIEALYDSAGLVPVATWKNPTPVTVTVPCLADRDNAVDLDLTVLRAAQQGFFDVSVEFDDLFCSAKLDCLNSEGQPLALLFDPATNARGQTAVVAFACTAGAGQHTTLYLDDVTVTCPGPTTYSVDPSGGPGNVPADAPGLFGAAIYRGSELFPGFEKTYWNTALGLDLAALGANCRLAATATASETAFDGLATPAVASWPLIVWDVAITNGAGALACGRHAVNAGTGVDTVYVPNAGEARHTFAHAAAADGTVLNLTPVAATLLPATGNTGDSITVSGQGFGAAPGTVAVGGVPATVTDWSSASVTFTIPAGTGSGEVVLTLADGATTVVGPWFTHTGIVPATPAALNAAAYSIWDLDFDAVGNTYYAEFISGQDSILKVAPDGSVTIFGGESDWNLGFVASTPDASVVIGAYAGTTPKSIGVVNAANHIVPVYPVTTGCSSIMVSGYAICGPADPEWGFDGYFYFGNGLTLGDVSRVSATAAPVQVATLPAYVPSVATLPSGELWAASGTGVYAVNRATGATALVATFGGTVRSIASSYYHHRIYVEVEGGTVYELDPATGTSVVRLTGLSGGGFLTIGPDFKLYRIEGRVDAYSTITVYTL